MLLTPDDQALIDDVVDVFTRKCSPCHAPGATDEKAMKDWGCSHDLAATLELEDLVVPGEPDDSDLYLTVEFGDMPPEDWEDGTQCTPAELEVIRAWIAGGAPVPKTAPPPAEPQDPAPQDPEATDPDTVAGEASAPVEPKPEKPEKAKRSKWRTWLGKWHPAAVHFPIALLLVAAVADLLRKRDIVCFLLVVGALSAVGASVLGWIAGETTPRTKLEELDRHRWTGVALSVWALAAMFLYPLWTRKDGAPKLKPRLLLIGLVILVSLAGHWGGELSWGAGYLDPPW